MKDYDKFAFLGSKRNSWPVGDSVPVDGVTTVNVVMTQEEYCDYDKHKNKNQRDNAISEFFTELA